MGCTGRWKPCGGYSATIERADLTAFLCLLRKAIGPSIVHVDNKWIIDGLWRGEMKCVGPKTKDADLWTTIWEELNKLLKRIIDRG